MKIFTIADLHFGAKDDEKLYNELCEQFLTKVYEEKPEIIVFAGDCYDKKVYVNSDASIYFNKFIHELVTKTDSAIIMVFGTLSHDANQLHSLSQYLSDKFYIVNKVSELNVLGLKLLILPEEYINDSTYYDSYLNKKYDFVFGHGMFKHASFGETNKIGHLNKKSYVFDAKQFDKNIKHYVCFGHIHNHTVYKKVIYTGSFSRMSFGEEDPKGFIIFNIDKKNNCTYEFIENTLAPTYKTIHGISVPEETELALNYLRGYSENNDYLRVLVIDPITDNVLNNILGFIKNHNNTVILKKTPNKTIDSIENIIEDKQKHIKEKIDKYKGLSFIEITQRIAKDEFHEDFSTEDIQKVINTPV